MKILNLQQIIQDAGFEIRSYSGRGMYGKTCLGVYCDDVQDLYPEISSILIDEMYDVATAPRDEGEDDKIMQVIDDMRNDCYEILETLKRGKTDSLGLGTILYFPNIKFEGKDMDED